MRNTIALAILFVLSIFAPADRAAAIPPYSVRLIAECAPLEINDDGLAVASTGKTPFGGPHNNLAFWDASGGIVGPFVGRAFLSLNEAGQALFHSHSYEGATLLDSPSSGPYDLDFVHRLSPYGAIPTPWGRSVLIMNREPVVLDEQGKVWCLASSSHSSPDAPSWDTAMFTFDPRTSQFVAREINMRVWDVNASGGYGGDFPRNGYPGSFGFFRDAGGGLHDVGALSEEPVTVLQVFPTTLLLNDAGQIVGRDPDGDLFLWEEGPGQRKLDEFVTFADGSSLETIGKVLYAYDFNNAGQIVGVTEGESYLDQRPFLIDHDTFYWMDDAADWPAGSTVLFARTINNLGQIGGAVRTPDGDRGFLLTPVPEPGALALLLAGLGAALLIARRQWTDHDPFDAPNHASLVPCRGDRGNAARRGPRGGAG